MLTGQYPWTYSTGYGTLALQNRQLERRTFELSISIFLHHLGFYRMCFLHRSIDIPSKRTMNLKAC